MAEILFDVNGSIATVRLNRPEKRNALSSAMMSTLGEVFHRIHDDTSIRAVILTGDEKSFCSGTDIAELNQLSEAGARLVSRRGQDLCDQLESFRCPIIAAVNGIAAGGGLELMLACHLRVVASDAELSLPEVKLGVIPAYGGTQRLVKEIGRARAFEMSLAGKTLSAEAARRLGLVNKVVEPSSVVVAAQGYAEEICELAPVALGAVIQAVVKGGEVPLDQGLALENKLFAELFSGVEVREGTRAFLEKRKPVFRGT